MYNWFECKVKYEKEIGEGKVAKQAESYLVDALNFTEAEKRIIKEMKPFISGEFEVSDIKRARFAEMFENKSESADKWYQCKIAITTIDEKKGVEKQVAHALLTRPPLSHPFNLTEVLYRRASFDLHVLGTPPAFVLSQDQTLNNMVS